MAIRSPVGISQTPEGGRRARLDHTIPGGSPSSLSIAATKELLSSGLGGGAQSRRRRRRRRRQQQWHRPEPPAVFPPSRPAAALAPSSPLPRPLLLGREPLSFLSDSQATGPGAGHRPPPLWGRGLDAINMSPQPCQSMATKRRPRRRGIWMS